MPQPFPSQGGGAGAAAPFNCLAAPGRAHSWNLQGLQAQVLILRTMRTQLTLAAWGSPMRRRVGKGWEMWG